MHNIRKHRQAYSQAPFRNGLRRSLTKRWFNDRWRGLVLGFVNFVSEDADTISLAVGAGQQITISSKIVNFSLNHGISSDPVSDDLSDESAEAFEQDELNQKLSDPVFSSLLGDEEDDDD